MDSMLARAGVDDDVKELSGPTQVTITVSQKYQKIKCEIKEWIILLLWLKYFPPDFREFVVEKLERVAFYEWDLEEIEGLSSNQGERMANCCFSKYLKVVTVHQ